MAICDYYRDLKLLRDIIEVDEFGSHTERCESLQSFKGAVTLTSSTYKKIGEQGDKESLFLLTTSKDIPIQFNDIIQDNNTRYRVINDAMGTPQTALLDIKQHICKKICYN